MKSSPILSKLLVLLILFSLSSCEIVPSESDLQTAAAGMAQTAVAQGEEAVKTAVAEGGEAAQTAAAAAIATSASAAQTAAAELATEVTIPAETPVVTYSSTTDLTIVPSVSGEEIDTAITAIRPDSPLIGLGDDFVRIGQELSINPIYIAAHAAWESTWGTSQIAIDKNNLFGYGAYDSCPYECAWTFETKAESVEIVMKNVKDDYLTEGGKYYNGPTLEGMNVNYATDPNWANGIASVMNSIVHRLP